MAGIIDEKTKKELKPVLKKLENPVTILYFTQKYECQMCREQRILLEEMTKISDKLKLKVYDFEKDNDKVDEYNIDKIPATVLMNEKDYGIRFFGVTGGYEFSSFLETIMMISTGKTHLTPELQKFVKEIDQPVHIQVMVTLSCPYCARAVHTAHQMAKLNDNIRADMVDSGEFNQLAQKYEVFEVPKIIINETNSFVGALPADDFYLEILKAVKPEQYQTLEEEYRTTTKPVRKPDQAHEYDMIIIGGGAAAMSATVYAARKEVDLLLLTKELGGQIGYTATIENYLGLTTIGGKEMIQLFRDHIEQYPIAEGVGITVVRVEKNGDMFAVETADKNRFVGKSVIYCAGKHYRRLGVPGEERFMGRGVAFCATCDAPLYRGKKVAVVGGGNSAFTAVRDLINFASEIYLINRSDSFKADKDLIESVRDVENVKIHNNMVIKKILGKENLSGVRLKSTKGEDITDLQVDGVFIEIGLIPNSKPVKDFVKLNKQGEIIVARDNSTSAPGFFAAGDVTDIPEKQIIVAAGEGAKAALTAYNYLQENKLLKVNIKN